MDQSTRMHGKTSLMNTFKHNLEKQYLGHLPGSLGWEDYYWYSLTLHSLFYLFIDLSVYLFTYLFFSLAFLAFYCNFYFTFFTISFIFSHNVFHIIYYISILLFHYVPNPFLLLMLQCHYSFRVYAFRSY